MAGSIGWRWHLAATCQGQKLGCYWLADASLLQCSKLGYAYFDKLKIKPGTFPSRHFPPMTTHIPTPFSKPWLKA
jgi:hypothetical protein